MLFKFLTLIITEFCIVLTSLLCCVLPPYVRLSFIPQKIVQYWHLQSKTNQVAALRGYVPSQDTTTTNLTQQEPKKTLKTLKKHLKHYCNLSLNACVRNDTMITLCLVCTYSTTRYPGIRVQLGTYGEKSCTAFSQQ